MGICVGFTKEEVSLKPSEKEKLSVCVCVCVLMHVFMCVLTYVCPIS